MPDWGSLLEDKPKAKDRWASLAEPYDFSADPLAGAALPAQGGGYHPLDPQAETHLNPITFTREENTPEYQRLSTMRGQAEDQKAAIEQRRAIRAKHMEVTQGFGGLLDEQGVRDYIANDKNTEPAQAALDQIYKQQTSPLAMAHLRGIGRNASLNLFDPSSPLQKYVTERREAEATPGERLGLAATGAVASLPAMAVGGELVGIPATMGVQGAAGTEGDFWSKAGGALKGAVLGKAMGVGSAALEDAAAAHWSALARSIPAQRAVAAGSSAVALSGANQAMNLLTGQPIDLTQAGHDALIGLGLPIITGSRGSFVHPVEAARLRQAEARGERTTRQTGESLSAENEMLAGSIPDTGVTTHDTLRAATAQAEGVLTGAEEGRAGAVAENKAALKRRRGIAAFAGRAVEQGVGSTDTGPRLSDVIRGRFPDATPVEIQRAIVDLHDADKIDTARAASELGMQWEPNNGPRPNRGMQGNRPMYVKKGEPVENPKPPLPWDLLTQEPFVGVNPEVAAKRAAERAAGQVEVPYAVQERGAAEVPVGQAPGDREAVDRGVRVNPAAQGQDAGRGPGGADQGRAGEAQGPLRQVGAVAPEGPTGESQRGAVGGPEAEPGKWAQLLNDIRDFAGRTKRLVTSQILRPAFGQDPDSAALIAKGAGGPQRARTLAGKMVDEAAPGWSAKDRDRLFLAYSEAQHRIQGDSLADTRPFRKAFPGGEEEYQRFADSDVYKTAAKNLRAQFDTHIRPLNERAGATGDISALEGPNGEFSNLIPMEQGEKPYGSRSLLGTPRAISGPSVPRSMNARQRTGGADLYDPNVQNQFERALARNGDAANRLDIVDSMLKNGSAINATDADGKTVEKPDGWTVFRPTLGKGLRAGPDEVGGIPTLYIKPEFESPLRARFNQNLFEEQPGFGKLAQRAMTGAQLFINPAAGALHVGFNVLPVTATEASPLRALAALPKALWYAMKPSSMADAVIEQTNVGGVREQHPKSTVPWLGKLSDLAGRFVDGADVAGREAVLETVKAKQAKGLLPSGVQAQHEALLQFGQYQRLLQDTTTKVFRAFNNPFAIIAKAGVDFAHSKVAEVAGFSPGTRTARIQQAAKIAALFGGYIGWNAIQNHKDTDEFFPDGIPFGSRYTGMDEKTGKPLYSWGPVGNALGVPRVLGWTPLAAVDPIRRGEGVGRIAAAPVEAIGHDIGHVIGYFPRMIDKITQEAKAGNWGKMANEIPVWKEVMSFLDGKTVSDSLFPGFGAKKGLSDKELYFRKNPKQTRPK